MVDNLWMRCTSTQLADSLVQRAPNDHECNVPAITVGSVFAAAKDQPQHRPLLPKLDILAVNPDEELQEEWEAEDDVKGGSLDPREARVARQKEIQYLWDMEVGGVRVLHRSRGTGANRTQASWPQVDRHQQR